ncbi:MAG TPA: copper resistance protein CopC [Dehalococcoidia bacterium]|jgi:copper transport protein
MTAHPIAGDAVRLAARRPAPPILLAVLGLFVAAVLAAPAIAHANLVRSNPAAGAVLSTPPTQAQLWFSEQPDPHFSDLQVVDAGGRRVDQADMHAAAGDQLSLIVGIKSPLADGLYTILWKTVSAVDGHAVNGSVPFYVGQPPPGVSVPAAVQVGPVSGGGQPGPGAVLDRWLGLLSAVVLAGGFAFWGLVLTPALRAAGEGPRRAGSASSSIEPASVVGVPPSVRLRVLHVLVVAWALLVVAGVAALVQQAMTASGKDILPALGAPLRTELLHTRYGQVWWLRAASTIAVGLLLLLWSRGGRWRYASPAICAGGFVAVEGVFLAYSLNSHGAALTSQSSLATAADFLHLSTTGLWLGGLAQFVLVVPVCLRTLGAGRRLRFLAAAVPRFSALALGSVTTILATGVYQAVRQLPDWGAFTNTGYGRTLLLKLLLFLPLLGLAAVNLLIVKPALARAACGGSSGHRLLAALRPPRLERGFLLAVGGETLLGLAILGVVGLLVNQRPPRTTAPAIPGVQLSAKADGVGVKLNVDPGGPGLNRFTAVVSDHGEPPPDGTQLVLRVTYQGADRGTSEITTQPQGRGIYTAQSSDLSAYGRWQIVALVQPPAADEVRTEFNLTVSPGGASGAGQAANGDTAAQPGRQLYVANCARCHGASGRGDGPDGRRLDPPPADLVVHAPQHSDEQLLNFIANGIPTTAMPAFSGTLTEGERQAILNYLRQLALGKPASPTPAASGNGE